MKITGTPEAWRLVATAVQERRLGDLQMTQPELSTAGGPGLRLISTIETAGQTSYEAGGIWKLETALRWQRGSIQDILDGGEPTPLEPEGEAPAEAPAAHRLHRPAGDYPPFVGDHPGLRAIWDIPDELLSPWEKEWACKGASIAEGTPQPQQRASSTEVRRRA